jgi:hypothetical protein
MIATIKHSKAKLPTWHADFIEMLPTISRSAQIGFRTVPAEARQELVQEVIANCFAAFARLVELGKQDLTYPTVLARFGIAQVRDGRRVGGRLGRNDVLSECAQRRTGYQVERLDSFDKPDDQWRAQLIEDRHAGPAETAICRLDFAAWLRRLPRRQRKIALSLASGETTSAAANRFGVTAARISQLRRWLKESWETFQGVVDVVELAAGG